MIQEFEDIALSHYRLQRLLACGGMSIVYIAEDTHTGRTVAIKLVSKSNHEYYRHFQREVQTLASLPHNHILPVVEYGEHDSWFYMVMPYITYGTLKHHLSKGLLSTYETGTILAQIADALNVAHEHGIVHGDIKPSNILLHESKHVYLADFGLARHMQETSDTSQHSIVQGTPEYMAPELTTQAATPSSDIYALGVLLYQMLTGRPPFKSSTPIGLYWKHLHEQPIAPSFYNPRLSRATDAVVLRALAKQPAQRFQTPLEFAHAYQASLQKRSATSFGMHLGAPAVAAVLFLCVMPSLLGFSFSYLTSHAQTPTRIQANEALVRTTSIAFTPPAPPQNVPLSTTPPPFLHPTTKVLMSHLVVKPATYPTPNDGDKDDNPKPKHKPKGIANNLAV